MTLFSCKKLIFELYLQTFACVCSKRTQFDRIGSITSPQSDSQRCLCSTLFKFNSFHWPAVIIVSCPLFAPLPFILLSFCPSSFAFSRPVRNYEFQLTSVRSLSLETEKRQMCAWISVQKGTTKSSCRSNRMKEIFSAENKQQIAKRRGKRKAKNATMIHWSFRTVLCALMTTSCRLVTVLFPFCACCIVTFVALISSFRLRRSFNCRRNKENRMKKIATQNGGFVKLRSCEVQNGAVDRHLVACFKIANCNSKIDRFSSLPIPFVVRLSSLVLSMPNARPQEWSINVPSVDFHCHSFAINLEQWCYHRIENILLFQANDVLNW